MSPRSQVRVIEAPQPRPRAKTHRANLPLIQQQNPHTCRVALLYQFSYRPIEAFRKTELAPRALAEKPSVVCEHIPGVAVLLQLFDRRVTEARIDLTFVNAEAWRRRSRHVVANPIRKSDAANLPRHFTTMAVDIRSDMVFPFRSSLRFNRPLLNHLGEFREVERF